MEPYICIHGHFYQPPRENPWLEAVEQQDSAYPYHDWNELITAQCYAPNAASRILDDDGRIAAIVNNYASMSFNFGPTLLSWLQSQAPHVHDALVEADRVSAASFSGHGSALAQAYNHMIMPLANERDRRTQVAWGLRDFEHRFHRFPEGMWLPETAVDVATLEVLAEAGIRFTILAPHQAQRVRRIGSQSWDDVSGARIDPSMPYQLRLPSGRTLALFFYDGPTSRDVAFEGLLSNGERFAQRLIGSYDERQNRGRLIHIATDGETYGHHHRFGDMALAYAIRYLETRKLAHITNYGEYLEQQPPTHEVAIFEDTSWSCAHGVERWRSNCGCSGGGQPGWNQEWRGPLRNAFDWLRDRVGRLYEAKGSKVFKRPWVARDEYLSVVLDRSQVSVDAFLSRQATHELATGEKTTALKLLEMQKNAMFMFTSCGWFFSELSGIETVQCMQYAGRAIQLADDVGENIESGFLEILERARSNIPEHGDGARIYMKFVKPAVVDLQKVGAHFAISSVFQPNGHPNGQDVSVYSYDVAQEDHRIVQSGRSKLVMGRVRVSSAITQEAAAFSYGVIHFGDHNLAGGDCPVLSNDAHTAMAGELVEAFSQGDVPQVVRLLDRYFGESTHSLKSLFPDEQRRTLHSLLAPVLEDAEALNRQIYDHNEPLMRYLTDLGHPMPRALHAAADLVINADLRRILSGAPLDGERVRALIEEAQRFGIKLDDTGLRFALETTLLRLAEALRADPAQLTALEELAEAVDLARSLPLQSDLWQVQNLYSTMLHTVYEDLRRTAAQGDGAANEWASRFISLGEQLGMRVPA